MNISFYKNSKTVFNKISTFVVGAIVIASFVLTPLQTVFAERMTSGSYVMESDSVNFEGQRSTSASYSLEDTGGEIGTGYGSSANSNLHAGFQQAATVAVTPTSTPPDTTPSVISSSGSQMYSLNVVNFIATPLEKNIGLSWSYPQGADIVSVRIVRSDKFFPNDISDGEIIFEGAGTAAVDNDVVIGTRYYYALFAKNSRGEYSSGVLAQARIAPVGDVTPPLTPEEVFENIPPAQNVDPVISALTLLDLDFLQGGRKISQSKNVIAVDGKENLTIRLDYNKVPEVLKTIAISLSDPEDSTKVFTFLLRVNKDKTAYEATIAPLGRGGDYKLNAIILDYNNQGLKRLNGNLRAFVLDEGQGLLGADDKGGSRLWLMVVFLAVAFIAIVVLVGLERRKKAKQKKAAEAQAMNKTMGGLLMFFLVFVQTVVFIPNFNKVAHAAVNPEINYQGKLSDSSGDPVADGTYSMVFNLYTVSTGGSTLWTETRPAVQVTNGLFSVLLGDTASLAGVDFNQTLYLGVTIGADAEMTPRKKLGTVPAAFVADTLDGLDSTQFLRSDATNATGIFTDIAITNASTTNITVAGKFYDSNGSAGTNGQVLKVSGGLPVWGTDLSGGGGGSELNWTYFNGSGIYVSTTTNQVLIGDIATTSQQKLEVIGGAYFSGNLGLGTTTPYAKLSVDGRGVFNQDVRANYFTATSTTVASTFPYASSTAITVSGTASTSNLIVSNNTRLGNLTGLLSAATGVVSAVSTSSLNINSDNIVEGSTNQFFTNARVASYVGASTTIVKANTTPIYGQVLIGNVDGGYTLTGTSTLGLITTNVAEGSNLYYTNTRVQTYLDALAKGYFFSTTSAEYFTNSSSTIVKANTTPNTFGQILRTNADGSYTLVATSTLGITANLSNVSGTLSVGNGGTGATTFGQGWVYSAGGTGAFAASTSPTVNYVVATSSTASILPYASSTAITVSGTASTSNLIASNNATVGSLNIASLSGLLYGTNGSVGTISTSSLGLATFAYLFPNNATSTLLSFNGGLTSYASTTIGGGTQTSGLTVSGGATTTGNTYIGGNLTVASTATSTFASSIAVTEANATSTFAGGIDISAGCFAVNGTCLGGSTYGDTNVNAFIHGSSTIPKTYIGNTFTADQVFTGKLTMGYASSTGITASYASTTDLIVSNNTRLGNLTGLLLGTGGVVSAVSTSSLNINSDNIVEGSTNLFFTNNRFDTRFDTRLSATTTLPNLTTLLGLTDIISTRATTTSATTTNLYISGKIAGAGLTSCSASGDKIIWNSTTQQFGCGADAGAGGGITALGAQYSSFQAGASQTFATSSPDANLQMTITSAGDVHTFTPTWNGFLSVARGGTGTSTAPSYGQLLVGNALGGYDLVSTSSLGIVSGGSSFAYPFPSNATSTLLSFNGGLTTSALTLGTLNGPLHANNGVVSATTSVGVLYGGTGVSNFGQGWIYSAGGTGALAASTSPTVNYITATSTTATSTLSGSLVVGMDNVFAKGNGLAVGRGEFNGVVSASGLYNVASGYAATFGGGEAIITGSNIGNLAGGYSITGGAGNSNITSSGLGAFAWGRSIATAANSGLTASGQGSVVLGYAQANTITASANGAFAAGYANNGNILSSGTGSFAFGNNVGATASLATAFGSGFTNALANSFMIGYGTNPTLIVDGTNVRGTYFVATSSTASVFPYASTTMVTATTASTTNLVVSSSANIASLTLDNLTGLLSATNGVVTAVSTSSLGLATFAYLFPNNATSTLLSFNGGLTSYASTTIGNGTQTGGLTVSGGATTTGNGYFGGNVGIGSTTPWAQLSVNPNAITGPSFAIGSSTATNFIVTNGGRIGVGTTSPSASFAIQGTTNNDGVNPYALAVYGGSGNGRAQGILLRGGETSAIQAIGGSIDLIGGIGLATDTTGGAINISGGQGTFTNSAGGNVNISAGSATLSGGLAGNVVINAGQGNNTPFGSISLATIGGNVGIGTTSPYAKLSVAGQVVAESFTATSTATSTFAGSLAVTEVNATSTFAGGISLSNGCFAINNTCLSSSSYSNVDANAFIHGSSTIPKTYEANIFTAKQTFGYASTTGITASYASTSDLIVSNNLRIATLDGLLYGTNGVVGVRATSTLGIALSDTTGILAINRGGTGTSTSPTYGQLLLGNALGGYDLVATSSLGLGSGTGTVNLGTLNRLAYYTGATAVSSADFVAIDASNTYFGIGTSTPYSRLSVWGAGTGTNRLFELTNNASTTLASVLENGTAYFRGNLGIGTTSPYAKLSVAGQVVAESFTATSTTATSTFAGSVNIGDGSIVYDSTTGTTSISYLETGNMSFGADSGVVSWIDMPVTAASANGVVNSYSANLNGNSLLTVYGVSNGSGGVINTAVGIGTTSPAWKLSVAGNGSFDDYVRASYFTATSTTASTFPYASTTMISATTASTTNLIVSNNARIGNLTGLLLGTGGVVSAVSTSSLNINSDNIVEGSTNLFFTNNRFDTRFDTRLSATTTLPNLTTLLGLTDTITTRSTTTNATTTNLYVSNAATIGTLSGLLYGTNGSVGTISTSSLGLATFGYLFPNNATSTLLSFNGGLTSYASTTIGGGTQTSGLTVSGGATTTGNTYIGGNLTAAASVSIPSLSLGGLAIDPTGNLYSYSTSTWTFASSTLLADNNTFGGNNTFSNLITGNISGNAGTATLLQNARNINGVSFNGGSDITITAASSTLLANNNTWSGMNTFGYASTTGISSGYASSTLYYGAGLQTCDPTTGKLTWADGQFACGTDQSGGGGGGSIGWASTTADINSIYFYGTNFVGIGSSTPYAKLAITNTGSSPSFVIEDSTSPDLTPFIIDADGNVGIGTTTPYAKLSVLGEIVGTNITATSTTATSTFAGGLNVGSGNLTYDFSTGVTSAASFQTGNLNFDTDAGMVSWADLPLSSAVNGSVQGYSASLNGSTTLSIYGLASGNGWLQGDFPRVAIGSSTMPSSKLTIFGNGTGTNGLFELVNSASTTALKVLDNGRVGVASTSPWRTFSVVGTASFNGLTALSGSSGDALCLNGTTKEMIVNTGAQTCTVSSARFKHDIKDLSVSGIDAINALRPATFVYNSGTEERIGFIAEEVAAVDSRLIFTETGSTTPRGVRYEDMVALTVKAIQEQQVQIGSIASTTSLLSTKNNDFENILRTNLASSTQSNRTLASAIDTTNGAVIDLAARFDSLKATTTSLVTLTSELDEKVNALKFELTSITSSSTLVAALASSTANLIASSTADILASSTPFMSKVFDSFMVFLESAAARVKSVFVKELHVEEKLCVEDVCINKDQLKALLIQSGGTASSTASTTPSTTPNEIIIENTSTPPSSPQPTLEVGTSTPSGETASSTPPVTPTPSPEVASSTPPTTPVPETTPTSEPEPTPAPETPAPAPDPAPAPAPEPSPAPTE